MKEIEGMKEVKGRIEGIEKSIKEILSNERIRRNLQKKGNVFKTN